MRLELSNEEAVFLHAQLRRHAQEVEDELVHSERREIQLALASDLEKLEELVRRLDTLVQATQPAA